MCVIILWRYLGEQKQIMNIMNVKNKNKKNTEENNQIRGKIRDKRNGQRNILRSKHPEN